MLESYRRIRLNGRVDFAHALQVRRVRDRAALNHSERSNKQAADQLALKAARDFMLPDDFIRISWVI